MASLSHYCTCNPIILQVLNTQGTKSNRLTGPSWGIRKGLTLREGMSSARMTNSSRSRKMPSPPLSPASSSVSPHTAAVSCFLAKCRGRASGGSGSSGDGAAGSSSRAVAGGGGEGRAGGGGGGGELGTGATKGGGEGRAGGGGGGWGVGAGGGEGGGFSSSSGGSRGERSVMAGSPYTISQSFNLLLINIPAHPSSPHPFPSLLMGFQHTPSHPAPQHPS